MWGPKQEKVRKPWVLRLYCWISSMRVSEEERSVRDGMQQFREVSKTRTIYSTETHTSDMYAWHVFLCPPWWVCPDVFMTAADEWFVQRLQYRPLRCLASSTDLKKKSCSEVCERVCTGHSAWHSEAESLWKKHHTSSESSLKEERYMDGMNEWKNYIQRKKIKKNPHKTSRVHSARCTQCIHVSSRKLKLPKDIHTK